MLRLAILLLIICLLFRWAFGKWPWQAMSTRPNREQARQRARNLLKVDRNASREQILAAHKRLIAAVHPDRGGSEVKVHEANDARDLLLEAIPNRTPSRDTDNPPSD